AAVCQRVVRVVGRIERDAVHAHDRRAAAGSTRSAGRRLHHVHAFRPRLRRRRQAARAVPCLDGAVEPQERMVCSGRRAARLPAPAARPPRDYRSAAPGTRAALAVPETLSRNVVAEGARPMFRFRRLEPACGPWQTLDRFGDRVVFQTREWLDFIGESQSATPVVAEIRDQDTVAGYFSGLIFRKFGVRILGSSFPGWT